MSFENAWYMVVGVLIGTLFAAYVLGKHMEKQIAELTVERDLAIDRIRLGFADYRYQVWGKIRALKAENRRLAAELATVKAELVAVVVKAALREALKVYADQLRESCDEVSHTFSGMKTTMEKPSGAESEVKT